MKLFFRRAAACITSSMLFCAACMLSCSVQKRTLMDRCLLECDSLYRDCTESCGGFRMGDTQDSRRKDAVLYGGGECVDRCDKRHDACRRDCEQYKSYDDIQEK